MACAHCDQPCDGPICPACIADGGESWLRVLTAAEMVERGLVTEEDA